MRRSTRRSSIMASSLDSSLDFTTTTSSILPSSQLPRNLVGNFSTKFSMSSFIKKVEELTHDQRIAIEKAGFGNVLRIPHHTLRKNLLVEWMERWDCKKQAFLLLGKELTISPCDAALILGLPVRGLPVVLDDDEPFSCLEEEYGASKTNRKISISFLDRRLESLGGSDDEDFVRTFLLFMFGTVLFHNSNGKLDSRYVSYLRDLDKVYGYAWGVAVLEDLFSWLSRRKEEQVKNMEGCLILLQIWSYEHIDIGRPNLRDGTLGFPRASYWESCRCNNSRQWFATKFDELEEHQVTWKLQVTQAELDMGVINELFEAESRVNEVETQPNTTSTQCMKLPPKSIRKGSTLHEESKRAMSRHKHHIPNDISEDLLLSADQSDVTVEFPEYSSCVSVQEVQQVHSTENSFCVKDDYRALKTDNLKLKEEMAELRRENATLRSQLSMIPRLEDEMAKLRKELADLKDENQHLKLSENVVGNVERLIFEYFDEVQDASHAK